MNVVDYKIFNIKVQKVPDLRLREILQSFYDSDTQNQIVTVNPEFILAARKNDLFTRIINDSSLSTIDGTGIIHALKFLGHHISIDDRLTGAQLIYKLIDLGIANNGKILFCLYSQGLTKKDKLKEVLEKKFPSLRFYIGDENDSVTLANMYKPQIILSTMGAPRQDLWLYENLTKMPSIRIAVGVGGAIDFLSGAIPRAPKIMRSLGFEWLWRLYRQPKRFKRIYRSIFVFYYNILKYKYGKNDK
jgi:N-acetylglucosaminyldiphosphoundecaprenol N-acetyl-beta-D-mannosaminyltransferase